MATKDIGNGWGDLNGSLTHWYCPKCKNPHPVAEWSIVVGPVGDGRKCPDCIFQAFHHGETMAMIPPEISAVVSIAVTKSKKKKPAKRVIKSKS